MRHDDMNCAFLVDAVLGCEVVAVAADALFYPRHTHVSTHVVGLIRAGSVRLERDGKTELLGPGDIFVISPHQAHSLSAGGGGRITSLCLDNAIFDQPGGRQRVTAIARAMRSLVAGGWLHQAEWTNMCRVLLAMTAEKKNGRRVDDRMAELGRELATHPELPSRLADMAAGAHLDKFHLVRKFRRCYGLAPRQFQNQNRLRKARRELLRPGCTITQAALRAGFYDQSHFIRAFKRLYGLAPSRYLAVRRDLRFSTTPA